MPWGDPQRTLEEAREAIRLRIVLVVGTTTRDRSSWHLDITHSRHHDACVRTTLTLDDDVAAKLKDLVRRKRVSFKEAVNSVLRRGLVAPEGRPARGRRFRTEVFDSAFRTGVDPLRLNQLSDDLEAEEAVARLRR
jgi:hypothetical protein